MASGQVLKRHAHRHQTQEGGNEEVAGAATWVQHFQRGKIIRPIVETAGILGNRTRTYVAKRRPPVWEPMRPPCAQRVGEKKPNHVRLGEELCHRWHFVRADLGLGLVDIRFFAGLPELVQPAERVRCGKHLDWRTSRQRFELLLVFLRQPYLEHRQVRPEHLRQHGPGEMCGQVPLVHVLLGRQLLALLQRDGYAHLRLDEQVILGKKPSEHHAVPVLVGTLLHQMFDGLVACVVALIADLPGMGPKPAPQATLRLIHVRVGLMMMDRQRLNRSPRTLLGHVAGISDSTLKLFAVVRSERLHARSLLITSARVSTSWRALREASTIFAASICFKSSNESRPFAYLPLREWRVDSLSARAISSLATSSMLPCAAGNALLRKPLPK